MFFFFNNLRLIYFTASSSWIDKGLLSYGCRIVMFMFVFRGLGAVSVRDKS